MNRQEMINILFEENVKVRHESFSKEEWIIVRDGIIYDENDYNMGGLYDEFLEIRKGDLWEDGWSAQINTLGDGPYLIKNYHNHYQDIYDNLKPFIQNDTIPKFKGKSFKGGTYIPFESRNLINRNDPCPCGSGLKYKKCCL